jgi:predicted transcriptional regulator
MTNSKSINDWIPLITKLVWPVIILILLIIFNRQVSELYGIVLTSIKEGRNVEIGGFLKLGEAAKTLEIGKLSQEEISIEKIGGGGGVVRKGTVSQLTKLQRELEQNPNKKINTMLINDGIIYSVELLKRYVSTLGLKYVVFQQNGAFDGWIASSTFVAQLPMGETTFSYSELKQRTIGISKQSVAPDENAKEVLQKMQKLQLETLPVVDENDRWLFFTTRGDILTSLMTQLMLEDDDTAE